jgi:D-glycero-D-manno-heptose 1,7-bisphosphate phosphatase
MLIIFDKDGTLIAPVGSRPANTPAEQVPLPGVAAKFAQLRAAGHVLAIASNQGGVAWGFLSEREAQALVKDAAQKVGGVDFWRCCCYDKRAATRHPGNPFARPSRRRKPGPGMLREIIRAAGVSPDDTLMVGDQDSDLLAAEAAGGRFVWAADFFMEIDGGARFAPGDKCPWCGYVSDEA